MRPDMFMLTNLMQSLSGGGGVAWLQAIMLASLFVLLIFRPERIRNVSAFRFACVIYVVSLVVRPTMMVLFVALDDSPGPMGQRFMIDNSAILMVFSALGSILLAASMLVALFALMPTTGASSGRPPMRHPLSGPSDPPV